MYTTIMASYLAGRNRAVSASLAGKAEKDEKKSVKQAEGMVQNEKRSLKCALYISYWSVSHSFFFFPSSGVLDKEKQPASASEYESIWVIYLRCK